MGRVEIKERKKRRGKKLGVDIRRGKKREEKKKMENEAKVRGKKEDHKRRKEK